jgi:hypothetical protein
MEKEQWIEMTQKGLSQKTLEEIFGEQLGYG